MINHKCTVCHKYKSVRRKFLPGDKVCIECQEGKPMPAKVYDVALNDHSFKMTFDGAPITWEIHQRTRGLREPVTSAMLEALVWPGMRILELGACFGYFTLQLADLVGPSGNVVSVEPEDSYFKLLNRNLKLNGISNVRAIQFFIHSQPKWKSKYRGTGVEVLSATQCLQRCFPDAQPDMIFIDIEGYEHDAFTDLFTSGWLKSAHPLLLWEMHYPITNVANDPSNADITKQLKKFGYQVHRVRGMNIGVHR